jgi:uncharacterized membrane protein HdeD (DUF308 family)
MQDNRTYLTTDPAGLDEVRSSWLWFLVLGIVLIVLGLIALAVPQIATGAAVLVFGVLMLIGGALQIAQAIWTRRWSGFFLHLLAGILYVVVGLMLVAHPMAGGVGLTLVLAFFFIVGGAFRMTAALMVRFRSRLWVFLGGLITFVLGVLIWAQWPESGLWVIGLFIGIDLIFNGWTWVMIALAARHILSSPS